MALAALFCLLTFLYGVKASPYSNPNCARGRTAITHLFEWKWTDIKAECERFLGPYGYCGVQISPPNENAVITNPNRPWWERYQPVSYKIVTRSGNEQEFRDMVETCNRNNVRIYVDTVINHMTGGFSGTGTAGSHFDGGSCNYPGVPFSSWDCNGQESCHSGDLNIHNYGNPNEVRNCKLVDLSDLRLSKGYVRQKIADYMNHLIDIGVGGFRVDAAKHMWPGDLAVIFGKLKNLRSDTFGNGVKPFIFQEVIDMGGEPIKMSEYFGTGRVTDFIYGQKLAEIFLHKTNQAKWLSNFGAAWGMPSSNDMVVFLSNHDNQRGHGGGGSLITFFDPKVMKIANAFMLADPYGFPRIMSSYSWPRNFQNGEDKNNWYGPPHNGDMSTKSVQVNADMSCSGGWICEHRWRQVYNMVAFRNVVDGTPMQHWWSSGNYQIAFSRGNKGFIVINADTGTLNANLNTGLPAGTYCDVISGNYENGRCTGSTVHVGGDGRAHFNINGSSDDPVVAIHIGLSSSETRVVGKPVYCRQRPLIRRPCIFTRTGV